MVSCPSNNTCCWTCYHKCSCLSHLSSTVSIDCCCWTRCLSLSGPSFAVSVNHLLLLMLFRSCGLSCLQCWRRWWVYTQLSSILTYQGHSQSADIVNHAAVVVVGLGCIEPPKQCTVDVFNILPYLCLLDSPCIHCFFLSLANSFFPLLCSLNRCLLVLLCSSMITWRQLQFQSHSSPVFSGVYATTCLL